MPDPWLASYLPQYREFSLPIDIPQGRGVKRKGNGIVLAQRDEDC